MGVTAGLKLNKTGPENDYLLFCLRSLKPFERCDNVEYFFHSADLQWTLCELCSTLVS